MREPQRNTTSTCSDGSRALLVGPLWICKLGDHEIIHKITVYMKEKFKDIISQETFKLLEVLREEININQPYIRYDLLFGYLKKNMPPIKAFIQFLSEHGVKASRSHFDPRAIKINISIRELMELLK
ncbi:MAG: hypothetical protein B6U89_04465 [Desulfurococcales archaeon ex4484_58]|nr:MAG: hypothetical protein B6U89_04465 [Desulfurococcales archaeon ex4484_58]